MQIWRSFDDVPADLGRTVVTIGNFDGVHLGHRHVLAQARATADDLGVDTVVAVTFDPHPMAVLRPEHAPPILASIETRARLLEEAGVDAVLVIPFDREIAAWSPEEFIDRALVGTLHARRRRGRRQLPFRLPGRGRRGPAARGRARSAASTWRGSPSTAGPRSGARRTSASASPPATSPGAAEALGRPFTVRGVVVQGDQRGRELGYPTANVPTPVDGAAPADGVYAGWLTRRDTGERFPAAISVGTNPTFDGERERRVESYVLDRDDLELYGVEVEVEFVERLRGHGEVRGRRGARRDHARRRTPRADHPGAAAVTPRQRPGDPLAATEDWFLEHGLSYFVPSERAAAREALTRRRVLPAARPSSRVVAALLAGLLGWLSSQVGGGPRGAADRGGRRRGDLRAHRPAGAPDRRLGPQAHALQPGLGAVHRVPRAAAAAGLHRVPLHQRRGLADDLPPRLRHPVAHRPAAPRAGHRSSCWCGCRRRSTRPTTRWTTPSCCVPAAAPRWRASAGTWSTTPAPTPPPTPQVTGYERWNLIVVLLVIQAVQVLVLVAAVFGFLLVFGSLIVNEGVQEAWTGLTPRPPAPFVPNVSAGAGQGLAVPGVLLRPLLHRRPPSPTRPTAASSSAP